jgi:hypothetical protein
MPRKTSAPTIAHTNITVKFDASETTGFNGISPQDTAAEDNQSN